MKFCELDRQCVCAHCQRPFAGDCSGTVYRECRPRGLGDTVAAVGPGTELKKLLAELGFDESMGCGCANMIARMNALGPARCREQIDSIVAKLNESKNLVGWWELAKAGATAVKLGLPLTIEGLAEEAIRRTEILPTPPHQPDYGIDD